MPRSPRIQFENAVYHIMARGDRREPIVYSDEDRETFVRTLAQACQKTGWEVFAWVLMDNHYHLALRTPKANLVEGMTWFQNTFTRRINTSNGLWGHLFGGRYKAILVENEELSSSSSRVWSDYLTQLIDYIHLNPARAGLVDGCEISTLDYGWSSLSHGYGKPPTKRPAWLKVQEGLNLLGESDTARGRRRYVERLDQWAKTEREEEDEVGAIEGQTLQSTLKRGWYWGSQEFRETILSRFGKESGEMAHRDNRSSRFAKDYGLRQAEGILREGLKHFGMSEEQLVKVVRGDMRRAAIAWRIWRETTVPQKWLVERFGLKSAANASHVVRRFEKQATGKWEKEMEEWIEISKHVA